MRSRPWRTRCLRRSSFEREIVDGAGHLTRTYGTAPVSVAEGAEGLRRRQAAVVGANRFGIPAIAHEECLTGYTAYQATVYPTSLAWGARDVRPRADRGDGGSHRR